MECSGVDAYSENIFIGRATLTYSCKDLWTLSQEGSVPLLLTGRTDLGIPPLWLESQVSWSQLDLFDSGCAPCMTIVGSWSIDPNCSFSELEAWGNVLSEERFLQLQDYKWDERKMLLHCIFRRLGWVSENQNDQYRSRILDKTLKNPCLHLEIFSCFFKRS